MSDEMATVPGPECPAPACPGVAPQGYLCESSNSATALPLGKYRVVNNLWGLKNSTATGQQCFWSLCDNTTAVAWGTSWEWSGGNTSSVLSYTAAMLGWHWSQIGAETGLPVQVSENRNVTCTWSFALSLHKGVGHNVAYDIWLGTSAAPSNPSDEIMIWLSHVGVGPNGSAAGRPVIAGAGWTLYESDATSPPWHVHTFIRDDNVNCATLNITDFINYLVQNQGLDPSKYLVGIEAGPETLNGQGQLDTQYYSCNVAPPG
jgi:xyloglucan-specific endo-beta-1,4-glucanase